ncbi:MAG: exonuclease domain-containing protein [Chitinivibrionales bacterium]|nr:exonuclease domain-containing protein [Chitinivibrionales bacterium]
MPSLKDLLSQNSDTDALKDIQRHAKEAARIVVREPLQKRTLFVPPFVAFDLETTGLDHKTDRITEIGAVVFEQGREVRDFSTLINPGKPIPMAITELTGITDAAVAGAPRFEEVAEKLLDFLRDMPLCGHQIEFDISFLKEELKRIKIVRHDNRQLDTALLARITMPELSHHNLKSVTGALKISHVNAHRALDDARASGRAAVVLIERLVNIPRPVRKKMAAFAPSSLIKWLLLRSLEESFTESEITRPVFGASRARAKLACPEKFDVIDTNAMREFFSLRGPLAAKMKGFYERPAQFAMAQAVTETMNVSGTAIIEAGPGTGKSLAYLIPAAHFALANNCRVLVATHTRNLQDQLMHSDLPQVRQAIGENFRFSSLKGRSNYLCPARWDKLLSGGFANISPRERAGLLPLIPWAEQTQTGDIEEQTLFNRSWFGRIWNMISADNFDCKPKACPQAGRCFFQRARQDALSSHVVVINHALFYAEIGSPVSFLGETGPIIFDEAHHLAPCGHRMLRVEVDSNRLHGLLDILVDLEKRLALNGALLRAAERLKPLVKQLRHAWDGVCHELGAWAKTSGQSGREFSVGFSEATFQSFSAVRFFLTAVAEAGDFFHTLAQDAAAAPAASGEENSDKPSPLSAEITYCKNLLSQLKADYSYLSAAQTPEHVFWCEGNHEKGWVKLCGVPLSIGGLLSEYWSNRRGAVVFTSATLSVAGSMDYFAQNIGLSTTASRIILPSHIKPHQALRCALRGAPEPDAANYPQFVASVLDSVNREFHKNMLALFTANTMMTAVYSALKNGAPQPGRTLLAQNITGSRHALVEELKHSSNVILLGLDSFWEGIDAPGQACEIVVIPRLPFAVPTHPLTLAIAQNHEERFGDSFFSYTIPEAVIRFKQGAGRLLRRSDDRGVLIVLDNRIITKGYGKQFTKSLDGEFTSFSSVDDLVAGMKGFFENPGFNNNQSRYVSLDED